MASVIQILSFVADFGMSLHDAAHRPRIDVSGPDGVNADVRLPHDILARLHADGGMTEVEHNVLPINFACPSLTVQDGAQRVAISDVMQPWAAALAQA
jgi:gamma-glutamyltranspeptidase/glutathione hydrolase